MKQNKALMHLIVLRTVRHTDRHSILSAYSLEAGRVAFAIPAGAGREASRRRALLMPLSVVECVARTSSGSDIMMMLEPRAELPLMSLRANPWKASVAIFMAEVLGVLLREGPPDDLLYAYLRHSIEALDEASPASVANFHICFLYGLGRFIGIEPDTSGYRPGMCFDMIDGCFRISPPLHRHFLGPMQAAVVASLNRMTYANAHRFKMSRQERAELLDGILAYYSLHHAALGSLKSLDVLRSLI